MLEVDDRKTLEKYLNYTYPDCPATGRELGEAMGWDLKVTAELETTDPPTDEEHKVLHDLKARTVTSRGEAPG